MPLGDNPFAVLTTVVAPAVLTNACSVLCLGTSNRIARVVDQSRVVADELKSLAPSSPDAALYKQRFGVLRQRAKHLLWALRLFYASLGSFACAVLIAIAGGALASTNYSEAFEIAAAIGFLVGAVGVGGLTVGCALMVAEVRLALKQTADDTEAVLNRSL
jgi:uncharacterized membrane protein